MPALAAGPLLAALPARATTAGEFTAVADATIFAEQGGGGAYDGVADGQGGSLWTSVLAAGVVRRALLRFDLASIPPGSVVLEARVEAFMIRLREPQTLTLHRVTAAWGEGPSNGGDAGVGAAAGPGDSTWTHRFWPGQRWASRGGDYLLSASAATPVSGWPAPVVWASTPALLDDVQGWVDTPAGNHGWMMIGTESGSQNATRLASRNNPTPAARPRLQVRWLEPAPGEDVPLPPWALALMAGAAALALRRRR
jgi:MYXO-CTERM domain-containing protein